VIVDTHLLISNILYKYLSNSMGFKVDRLAFAYGNIKPDFNDKEIKCPHTLEESINSVNKYAEKLMRKNISIQEFSMSLGVICHFTCDYFCIYHREGNDKKGIFEHLFYEICLHIRLLKLLLKGNLNSNNDEILEDTVEAIVVKLGEKYNLEPKGLNRDINYALLAVKGISKLIVCSTQLYYNQYEPQIVK